MAIQGTWTRLLSSDRLRRSSHMVTAIGDTVCIFGGELEPREPLDNQIDIITVSEDPSSPTTLKTNPIPAAPAPRFGSVSALCNDRMYLFSGRGGPSTDALDEDGALWNFEPESSSWHQVRPINVSEPYPCARSYHAATSDGSSMVLISSGCGANGRLSDFWKFDLFGRSWVQLPDAPGPARGSASMVCMSGKVYRMNGFDGKREVGGALDVFDIDGMQWSTVTWLTSAGGGGGEGRKGPEARSVCALLALAIGGREKLVTLFGERDPSALGHAGAGKMLGDVWVYDIEDQTWTEVEARGSEKGRVPEPRGWFGADVLRDSEGGASIVVHGGLGENNERLGDVWQLTFEQ